MNAVIDISDVVIQTKRLTLRPWRESDLEDLYEYASVDGVGQMAGWFPHKSKEESRKVLSHFIQGKHVFALEYQGKVIGSLGIEAYNEEQNPEFAEQKGREIGYVLSKAFWGRGLMSEAVQAVIRYCFQDLGLDFLTVGHYEWNTQSRRVIEKCGFAYYKNSIHDTRYGTHEPCREYILYRKDQKTC